MRLLIVGYGKMGRMVEELAVAEGVEIVGRVDQGRDEWADADVAVDFSTADALLSNFSHYTKRRLPAVIGTTGWNAHLDRLRAGSRTSGYRHRRVRQFFDRCERLRARGRRSDPVADRSAAVRRLDPRDSPFGQTRCPLGDGAAPS